MQMDAVCEDGEGGSLLAFQLLEELVCVIPGMDLELS